MDQQVPAGPVLDELGVSLTLSSTDRVTEVLVIAKVVDLETGTVALMFADNDLDWIAQRGLWSAAEVVMNSSPVYAPNEDDD